MTTLVFNLGDCRLKDDERKRLLQLSNNLARRPFERAPRSHSTQPTGAAGPSISK